MLYLDVESPAWRYLDGGGIGSCPLSPGVYAGRCVQLCPFHQGMSSMMGRVYVYCGLRTEKPEVLSGRAADRAFRKQLKRDGL